MTHVLLAVGDKREPARKQAETVVDIFDPETLEVTLFHTFKHNPEGASIAQLGSSREAAKVLEEAGVEPRYQERGGEDPADAMVDVADEIDIDVICVGRPSHSPAGKLVFGSVSQSVIFNAGYPVLFATEQRDE